MIRLWIYSSRQSSKFKAEALKDPSREISRRPMSVTQAGLPEALNTTRRSMSLNVAAAKGGRSRRYIADEEGGKKQPNELIDKHVDSPLLSPSPFFTQQQEQAAVQCLGDRLKSYRGSQSEVSGGARLPGPSTTRGVSGVQLATHAFAFATHKNGLGVLRHGVKGDMGHRLLLCELYMLLSAVRLLFTMKAC